MDKSKHHEVDYPDPGNAGIHQGCFVTMDGVLNPFFAYGMTAVHCSRDISLMAMKEPNLPSRPYDYFARKVSLLSAPTSARHARRVPYCLLHLLPSRPRAPSVALAGGNRSHHSHYLLDVPRKSHQRRQRHFMGG